MPTSGPVYQPTTVSYEPRAGSGGGSGGLGLLGQGSSLGAHTPFRVFRKPRPQVALLLFAVLSLAAGVAMLASASADWIEAKEFSAEQHAIEQSSTEQQQDGGGSADEEIDICNDWPLGVLFGGIFMTIIGIVCMGIYLRVADWRRNCVCPCGGLFDKKQTLARQLQCQNGGGCSGQGIMALNPSTDPLVSHTQYAPVSELPSLRTEDEERRNLMPDSKDCLSSAEESDRMLEPDPRILLRPMGRVEDA